MIPILTVSDLSKVYETKNKPSFTALRKVNLQIKQGEIFALLGPNGAGKTTLISIICGLVNASAGSVSVGGFDIISEYKEARSLIGLVPQELTTDSFESVWDTLCFSRGLFGKPPNPEHLEQIAKDLSLWDKKDSKVMTLSGGMKRRLMIAKALTHEPQILFLYEPTAGVDVELRKSMWRMVHRLRESGVTIILTTHYIEEAQEMADRIGVINNGELILTEGKAELIRKLGNKQVTFRLTTPLEDIPQSLAPFSLELDTDGYSLTYTYSNETRESGIANVLQQLAAVDLKFSDLHTKESSLEEIFVSLLR